MTIKALNRERGFTLLELILVIVIIGILAAVAVQNGRQFYETAKIEETRQEMDALARAIVGNAELENNGVRADFGYVGDVGSLPPDLDALVSNPASYATWNGPYITNRYAQVADDFKRDAWGSNYVYSGGVNIVSVGSGTTMVRSLAAGLSNLLANRVEGNVLDLDGTAPGSIYRDSVAVEIFYPDGSGGITLRSSAVDAGGFFRFDSIPVGNHTVRLIYAPAGDTLDRPVTVIGGKIAYAEYRLVSNVWFDTAAAGGGPGSASEVLRPIGAGSSTALANQGCAANWQCVAEVTADDDGSCVIGPGANEWRLDLYDLENHSAGGGSIDSIVVTVRGIIGHPSSRMSTVIRTGGNAYEGSQVTPGDIYAEFSTTYPTNPQTSSVWTWSDIDGLEAGVSIRRTARCTQVWVEVFYTE